MVANDRYDRIQFESELLRHNADGGYFFPQRLAIARALLKDSPIIILDEVRDSAYTSLSSFMIMHGSLFSMVIVSFSLCIRLLVPSILYQRGLSRMPWSGS